MNDQLTEYILSHMDDEEPVLRELERFTNLNVLRPRMISGHIQGSFLRMICKMIDPEKILEIGTFTGYSSICMAYATNIHTHIHTIEINDELENIIRRFYDKAGVKQKVTLHMGDALNMIDDLDENFDLIFLDGDKRQYPEYYEATFPKLRGGGYMIADNTLWGGKVGRPGMPDDEYTRGIMTFNKMIKNDDRIEKVIIPIRDGLTVVRKTD